VRSLRRRKEIQRTFREGERVYSSRAVLHARQRGCEEAPGSGPRLAVVAGKRFRTSVARNRARRLLRETTRGLLGQRPAAWDLILVARTELLESAYPERLAAIQGLLQRAGVLDEASC